MTREEFVQRAVLAIISSANNANTCLNWHADMLIHAADRFADALYPAKGDGVYDRMRIEIDRVTRARDGVVDEMQALRVELQLARQQRDSLMSVAETLFMLIRNCGVGQSAGDTIARIRDEIAREGGQ